MKSALFPPKWSLTFPLQQRLLTHRSNENLLWKRHSSPCISPSKFSHWRTLVPLIFLILLFLIFFCQVEEIEQTAPELCVKDQSICPYMLWLVGLCVQRPRPEQLNEGATALSLCLLKTSGPRTQTAINLQEWTEKWSLSPHAHYQISKRHWV